MVGLALCAKFVEMNDMVHVEREAAHGGNMRLVYILKKDESVREDMHSRCCFYTDDPLQ